MITEKFFTELEDLFADYFEKGCSSELKSKIEKHIEDRAIFEGMTNDQIEIENEKDLWEMKHFYGDWDKLVEVIEGLQESDDEAAYERAMNDY